MIIAFPNPPSPQATIDRLREEINRLVQEQNQALEKAAYVGMSSAEQKDYDHRHDKLVELLGPLSALDPSQ